MDEDTSKSKVNDEDLDQMIASIKGQPATPPTIVGQGAPISSSDGSTPSNGQDDIVAPATPPAPTEPVSPPMTSLSENDEYIAPQDMSAPAPEPIATPVAPAPTPVAISTELNNIKRDALSELRPLVDKLTLPPEEKFNTILLIIRSTDDPSLLPAAHETARSIPDENLRAQALLDVIKEVDFFGQK